ncbi:MAG: hypothetical protein ILP19_03730 [Oscillospiraceae bacterium]|nr:hypothetical protein [Oscillospiraceae bacterium]
MTDIIRQYLIDAGCDDELISRYELLSGDRRQQQKLLSLHRKELLDEVHDKERCISRLDYLLFMMTKEDI